MTPETRECLAKLRILTGQALLDHTTLLMKEIRVMHPWAHHTARSAARQALILMALNEVLE